MKMKQKIVGSFPVGVEYCELVFREGTGGEFYVMPEPGHIPRIKVGADQDEWDAIVVVILHEALELILSRLKCRYETSDDQARDMYDYLFIAQHKNFSDACVRLADFLVPALPATEKAWKAWKQESKEEKRSRMKR